MLLQYGAESDPRWGWLRLLDAHAAMQSSVPARIYSRRESVGKWSLSTSCMKAICGVASARPDLSRTALLDWYGHCVVRARGAGGMLPQKKF